MKKHLLLLVTFLLSISANAQQKAFDHALEKAEKTGYSGVMLVADKGEILFEKAVGLRSFEEKIPLETTDVFEMASVSKQFTAMMVMMCQEKGLLDFDDPIEKYIRVPYPNISIRHLLTHTSGLPDYQAIMDEHWDKSKAAGNPDILEYLRRYAPPKLFEPGEKYEYSNTGYVILASIVEEVTNRDFVELSKDWIFDPLEMENTAIRSLEEKTQVPNFAAGHLQDEQGNYVNANRFRSSDYTLWLGNRKGPGRVSSTAQDLFKWDQALYTEKLVNKETLEEAFSPFRLRDGTKSTYGFGWEIITQDPIGKIVMHTGDNPGYKTIIVRFIDEMKTLILLNNNYHETQEELVEATRKILGAEDKR